MESDLGEAETVDARSSSHWELLLDASDDGFWEWPRTDQDGQWWSDGFYRLVGLAPAELTPGFQSFVKLVHPSDRVSFDSGISQAIERGKRHQLEVRLRLRNRSYRWFRIVLSCDERNSNDATRVTGSIRDVQAQREARIEREDTDELFRSVFERTTVGLALIDGTGVILHANPALSRMLGVSADQVKGVEWRSIVHVDDWGHCQKIHRQIFAGEADYLQMENRYRAAGNTSFDALTGLSRLSHAFSNGARVIAHIQDVSALKQAERAANEANMCKSQFLAQMSHEIRTPLNGVMGMTQLVLATELSDEQRDFLVTAQESSEQLLEVINDILDLSKIEAGKMEIAANHFELRDSLMSMSAPLSLRAHEKGLEFVVEVDSAIPDQFVGDWARLQQVLINLIGNAIKFTESGEVIVKVHAVDDEPTGKLSDPASELTEPRMTLQFSVADTGIGIPQDQQDSIFAAFTQVDPSLNRGHQGTGLGLAISSELVQLMGGQIEVSSEPGSGSEFRFMVKMGWEEGVGQQSVWEPRCDLARLSVMIVDPSISTRAVLARLLRSWGITVTSVGDLNSARGELAGDTPEKGLNLILLDSRLHMESGDLPEGLARSDEEGTQVALMVSSPDRADEVARCRALGFSEYFLKPIDPRRLLALLERLAGHDAILHLSDEVVQREQETAGLRFLVVEDSPISRKVVVSLLERQGHRVVTAANGIEAVLAVGQAEFDAVLMDVNMPEMDGLQATNLIREKEVDTGAHVWIIALTAQALKGDRERCLAAGMDDYLSKPIRWPALWEAIDRIPQRRDEPGQAESANGRSSENNGVDVLECPQMVDLALEEVALAKERIVASMETSAPEELQTSAHRLKGVLRQCQLRPEADLAAQLETLGRERRLTAAAEVFDGLLGALDRVDNFLVLKRQALAKAEHAEHVA